MNNDQLTRLAEIQQELKIISETVTDGTELRYIAGELGQYIFENMAAVPKKNGCCGNC